MASSYPVDAKPKQNSFEEIRNTLLSSYGVLEPLSPTISEFVFDTSNHLYYFGSLTPGAPESILTLDLNSADIENLSAVQIVDPQCARCVSRNLTPEQVNELELERSLKLLNAIFKSC